jgi:hypothetical protein
MKLELMMHTVDCLKVVAKAAFTAVTLLALFSLLTLALYLWQWWTEGYDAGIVVGLRDSYLPTAAALAFPTTTISYLLFRSGR